MGDYHLHLHPHGPYTGDGPPLGQYPAGHIESYVEVAARRGIEELCFTEHLYRCVESEAVLGRFWEDEPKQDLAEQTERFVAEDRTLSLGAYVEAVVAAKDRGLPVLLGLEVDFFPETIDAVLDMVSPYPWDLLIGSVHWLGGWSLDHPEVVHEFTRRGVRQAYEDYFAAESVLAESGKVDVLAHVDLIKVFGHRLGEPPSDLYGPVVEGAARSGTAVEINTSGVGRVRHTPLRSFSRCFTAQVYRSRSAPMPIAPRTWAKASTPRHGWRATSDTTARSSSPAARVR